MQVATNIEKNKTKTTEKYTLFNWQSPRNLPKIDYILAFFIKKFGGLRKKQYLCMLFRANYKLAQNARA